MLKIHVQVKLEWNRPASHVLVNGDSSNIAMDEIRQLPRKTMNRGEWRAIVEVEEKNQSWRPIQAKNLIPMKTNSVPR